MDITTEEDRTFRLSLLTGIAGISVPLAHVLSIYIYESGGNLAIWLTTLSLLLSSLVYIIFFVKDSRGRGSRVPSKKVDPIKTISDKEKKLVLNELESTSQNKHECATIIRNLLECFVVTFKPREGHRRAVVLILMSAMCLILLSGC